MRTAVEVASGATAHQGFAPRPTHQLTTLVVGPVLKSHNPGVSPGTRPTSGHHLGLDVQGVAQEHRGWERRLLKSQVGHRGPQGGVSHTDPDHQTQGEQAVNQALAELRASRELGV